MPEALAQLLAHGKLEAGTYRYDNPLVDLPFAANTLPEELTHLAKEKSVSFAFTARHAKLLHTETLPALQVWLLKATIAPGEYPRIELEKPLF